MGESMDKATAVVLILLSVFVAVAIYGLMSGEFNVLEILKNIIMQRVALAVITAGANLILPMG